MIANIETYIKERITTPIDQALKGECPKYPLDVQSGSVSSYIWYVCKEGHNDDLRNALTPYFRRFIWDEEEYWWKDYDYRESSIETNPSLHWRLQAVHFIYEEYRKYSETPIQELYDGFNIIEFVEKELPRFSQSAYWRRSRFCKQVLTDAVRAGHTEDWQTLAAKVEPELLAAPQDYNPERVELYCFLSAMTRIALSDASYEDKQELYKMLFEKWEVIVHIYSIMTGLIVGTAHTQMAQVIELFTRDSKKMYAMLMWAAIQHRPNILSTASCQKVIRKLEKEKNKIQQLNNELNPLCKIIFPQTDWEKYGSVVQRQSMAEIMEMIGDLKKSREALAKQLKQSLTIEEIEEELAHMTPGDAWDTFILLNGMFLSNEGWQKRANEIKRSIQNRINGTSVGTNNGIVAGGNLNANFSFTNEQVKMLIEGLALNGEQSKKLLTLTANGNNNTR